jgi:peroxiredoxin family protein
MPCETICATDAADTAATPDDGGAPALDADVTILAFSGDFDRITAALMVATGAAAAGQRVHVYFAFWGLVALKQRRRLRGKSLVHRMLTLMLPSGPATLSTSRLNMGGIGPWLFRRLMKETGMPTPEELLVLARDLGVKIIVCQTSMDVMGIGADELLADVHHAGVASFAADATRSKTSLVF